MTADILLHPATAQRLADLAISKPHGVLLTGPVGIGKDTIAELLAAKLLNVDVEAVQRHPHVYHLHPDGASLSIEQVRELEHVLALKVPGSGEVKRIVILHDASKLTLEAQNALLKTLEEPPSDTVIILTSPSPRALLPTVVSRLTMMRIQSPATTELESHFTAKNHTGTAVKTALAIANGLPGLTTALLTDDDHPLASAIVEARSLLAKSTFERLAEIDRLSKDRNLAQGLFFILQQMASLQLKNPAGAQPERWSKILEAAYQAEDDMNRNAQPKLVLMNFMLNLS